MGRLLEDKVVIVTGGARGIGAATCRVMAAHGAAVVVNYATSAELGEAVAASIRDSGGRAIAVGADVREFSAVQTMIDRATRELGPVYGLINNAIGGRQSGRFDELEDGDFLNMFDFCAMAVVNTVRAARPVMRENGGGRIVNIVSEQWNMGNGGWSAYNAAKGAMVGLSRSLAHELGPEGITVNMVSPGWMATERVDTSSEGSQNFAKSLPLKVHGSADEIGKACVFYLSELADYVTGTYLPVAGGRITQMGA